MSTSECPICGKSRLEQFRPFCSRRCADIDLHRWLSGVYAAPDEDGDDRAYTALGEAHGGDFD